MTGSGLDGDFGGSFPFEARYIEVGDVRLHYVDEGPRDGEPLLFVQQPDLELPVAEADRRAVGERAALRGVRPHGLRAEKPAQLARYTQAHVDNAHALIEELDLRDVTLVAHDWGGPIGFGAVLKRPDLRAAVLMNTWAWELPSFVPAFIREFRTEGLGEILVLGGNLFVESIPGGMARRDPDPVMMDAYRARSPTSGPRVAMLAAQRDIPFTERDRSASAVGSIHERLDDLDIPVTLVWGMRDRVFQPVFMEQWRELFPGAGVVELADAAHFVPEDRPDAVIDAL